MTLECVVDASVGIKLFINELLSDQSDALFAHLSVDPRHVYGRISDPASALVNTGHAIAAFRIACRNYSGPVAHWMSLPAMRGCSPVSWLPWSPGAPKVPLAGRLLAVLLTVAAGMAALWMLQTLTR